MPVTVTTSKTKPPGSNRFLSRGWEQVGRSLYGEALYRRYPWNKDETLFVVAREGKRLVGFAHLWIDAGVVFVEELLIHRNFRGQGVGGRVMEEIERIARKRNAHKIALDTDPKLEPANTFYKKCGFKAEATLPRHYAKRPTVFYGKRLD